MVNATVEARRIADAYRQALRNGDKELATRPTEKRILHAAVTSSAAQVASWIKTRVPDGDQKAAPLVALVDELAAGDVVGRTMEQAAKQVLDTTRQVVSSVIFAGAVPVWIGSAIGFVLGITGFVYAAGFAAGSALATGAISGGVFWAVIQGLTALGRGASSSVGELWEATQSLGAPSQALLTANVVPTLRAQGIPVGDQPAIVSQLRATAQTTFWGSLTVAAFAVGVFLYGLIEAFGDTTTTTSGF